MKKISCLLMAIALFCGCGGAGSASPTDKGVPGSPRLLSKEEAASILGEPVVFMDSSTSFNKGVPMHSQEFRGATIDKKSGRAGALYYGYEEYPDAGAAASAYEFIRKGNEDHGIVILHDLGDEAYFHTDHENFYFILARKGSRMIRMKVNRITPFTSEEQFKLVARQIISAL